MLPRLAELDREFDDAIRSYMQGRSRRSPLLNQIKAHTVHEGRSSSIRRSPTEIEPTTMREASVEAEMRFDDIEQVDTNYMLHKANEIAEQFEKQFSLHLFSTIDETTKKTGLRSDNVGAPLTHDGLIELMSRMQMNFEKSEHGDLTIVTAPGMEKTFQRLERERIENPEIKKKWDEMMEKKRREFREREINRNLVG
jgi:hypothetical protein